MKTRSKSSIRNVTFGLLALIIANSIGSATAQSASPLFVDISERAVFLPSVTKSPWLSGSLTQSGKPVANARLELSRHYKGGSHLVLATTTTNMEGQYFFPTVDRSNLSYPFVWLFVTYTNENPSPERLAGWVFPAIFDKENDIHLPTVDIESPVLEEPLGGEQISLPMNAHWRPRLTDIPEEYSLFLFDEDERFSYEFYPDKTTNIYTITIDDLCYQYSVCESELRDTGRRFTASLGVRNANGFGKTVSTSIFTVTAALSPGG